MKKIYTMAATAIIMMSCTQAGNRQQETDSATDARQELIAKSYITPLESGIDINNLDNCSPGAKFTVDDFDWMGGNLSMTIYEESLYDAPEVNHLKVGDSIVYNKEIVVVKEIKIDGSIIDINGGIEEGGICLKAHEGGTYRGYIMDGHSHYDELGKVQVALSEDFEIVDCGVNPDDTDTTITTGQKSYLEGLEDWRKEFSPLNTKVDIEDGMIRRIRRIWIP